MAGRQLHRRSYAFIERKHRRRGGRRGSARGSPVAPPEPGRGGAVPLPQLLHLLVVLTAVEEATVVTALLLRQPGEREVVEAGEDHDVGDPGQEMAVESEQGEFLRRVVTAAREVEPRSRRRVIAPQAGGQGRRVAPRTDAESCGAAREQPDGCRLRNAARRRAPVAGTLGVTEPEVVGVDDIGPVAGAVEIHQIRQPPGLGPVVEIVVGQHLRGERHPLLRHGSSRFVKGPPRSEVTLPSVPEDRNHQKYDAAQS